MSTPYTTTPIAANYVRDELCWAAQAFAKSLTPEGEATDYSARYTEKLVHGSLEIAIDGGGWIQYSTSGEYVMMGEQFDDKLVLNLSDKHPELSSSAAKEYDQYLKQVHLEVLRIGAKAEFRSSKFGVGSVDVASYFWPEYTASSVFQPVIKAANEPNGTVPESRSEKMHFSVPVLPREELASAKALSKFEIIYTPYAEGLKAVCKAHINEPIYLNGVAGTGKSLLCQILGVETGKKVINRVTFTAKMDVAMTLGNRYPTNMWQTPEGTVVSDTGMGKDMSMHKFLGIGLAWRDGIVTRMARSTETGGTGGMLVLDELPKAPPEFVNRLHEILEDEFPTMTLYENAEDQAAVNDDLWIMATGNPVGGGYFNNPLDKALLDRMRVFNVNKPIADEEKILAGLVPEKFFGDTAQHLIRAAKTLRDNEETAISTRALIMVGKSLLRGVNVVSAFQINYFNTLNPDSAAKAEAAVQTHFFADWEKHGPTTVLGY